ncbi:hypothetical protein [uncultured Thalassolituus sp.]|uniref:hypothetical protein n=1 Tax=Thalassolituus sp. TaxID=2030822 RepID=UPI00262C23DB|nr:hypothetical protein [uncultured Thalassolituus sp.]
MTISKHDDFQQKSHVGVRLLSYLLAFSFFVTLAASVYVLYSDYDRGISQFQNHLSQIQSSYQQSVSYSLWNFDNRQIESQLNGILNFPGVVYVYIESRNKLVQSAGDIYARTDQQYSFELTHQSASQNYHLGNLYINVDYTGLYDDLKHKAVTIILSQFVKTFSVSIFVLFLVRSLITHRLNTMAEWARGFSLNNLDQALEFDGGKTRYDELDMVADAINRMRDTLKQDAHEREQSKQQLIQTKEQLSVAIDNASLGFARYFPELDRLECNNHFARQLATTQHELEAMVRPMEHIRDLIRGIKGPEQRERINQLLYGRISRIHGEFTMVNFRNDKCYFDITLQILQFNESRPKEILICIVDKTKEQAAGRQAQELAISLENKVTQRTEELYEEQQRANNTIRKLQARLERSINSARSTSSNQFKKLLTEELSRNFADKDLPGRLPVFRQYLDICLADEPEPVDITGTIREVIDASSTLHDIKTTTRLPFSLIISESPALIRFVLAELCESESFIKATEMLDIDIRVGTEVADISLTFHLTKALENLPDHPNGDLLSYIVSSRFRNELKRELKDASTVVVSFGLNLMMDDLPD